MNKLWKFELDCGRMGTLDGLFVATDADIKKAIGTEIYFGEVLGKHSEIICTLTKDLLTIKSDDQAFIEKLVSVIGTTTISGHNPLNYIEEE